MTTKKNFINGKPEPITPVTTNQIVEDNTPGQVITSDASDYDEDEHSDDIAAVNVQNSNSTGEQKKDDPGEDEEA